MLHCRSMMQMCILYIYNYIKNIREQHPKIYSRQATKSSIPQVTTVHILPPAICQQRKWSKTLRMVDIHWQWKLIHWVSGRTGWCGWCFPGKHLGLSLLFAESGIVSLDSFGEVQIQQIWSWISAFPTSSSASPWETPNAVFQQLWANPNWHWEKPHHPKIGRCQRKASSQ
jgi:hypothetical protein